MNEYQQQLLNDIQAVNSFTNQCKVKELCEKVKWLNINDKSNRPILEAASEKL